MQGPRLLRQLAARQVGMRSSSSYVEGPGRMTTYNDLPSPQGSWKTHYDAKQRSYNAHLVLGIGSLIGTIVFGKAAGFLEFYNDIPDRPADIDNYKS